MELLFPGVNNWNALLNWATGQQKSFYCDAQKFYVGCRMLQANKTGKIVKINSYIKKQIQNHIDVCDIALTKSLGETITNNLKDNSHLTG